jgi:hypothetical protein
MVIAIEQKGRSKMRKVKEVKTNEYYRFNVDDVRKGQYSFYDLVRKSFSDEKRKYTAAEIRLGLQQLLLDFMPVVDSLIRDYMRAVKDDMIDIVEDKVIDNQ